MPRTTAVCLHALGMSSREYRGIDERLAREPVDLLGIDLPGFGETPITPGLSVAEMTAFVLQRIADAAPQRWMLVGHSMGGKIAASVAAAVRDGAPVPGALVGVVGLAPSPPSPEPMSEDKRAQMVAWADGPELSRAHAEQFVAQNTGAPLDPADRATALADLRRSSTIAWRHWFDSGSREDISARVGAIDLPALILGGSADADLGYPAQLALLEEVYPRAEFERVEGAGHLLPYERPELVASAIGRLVALVSAP